MKTTRFFSMLLSLALLFGSFAVLTSCDNGKKSLLQSADGTLGDDSDSQRAENISEDIRTGDVPDLGSNDSSDSEEQTAPITLPVEYNAPTSDFVASQLNFSLELFKESVNQREDDSSMLISPLSVALALAMTANGADGETLAELEELLGMPIEQLNEELRNYVGNLPSSENSKLHLANSIWLRETHVQIKDEFAETNKEYFNADVMARPFDETTVEEINGWVEKNTDGMIKKLLAQIDNDAMLYLINALVFDAKWESQYTDYQVREEEFITLDGTVKTVNMLCSDEKYYINDGNARGFIKRYQDGYSFVALLPNEGISVYDYVAGLDDNTLYALISDPLRVSVDAKLPEFKYEYSTDLVDTLKAMGLDRTFLGQGASFGRMCEYVSADGPLAVSRVLHKTAIELTQAGTRAAAVTAVEMVPESACPDYMEHYQVYLDRPFVYMIVDNDTCLPIFMGTVTDIAEADAIGSVVEVEPTFEECKEMRWLETADEVFEQYVINKEDVADGSAPVLKITSKEELDALYKLVYPDGTGSLFDLSESYFDKNLLLLTYLVEGSGSITHEIGSCFVKTIDGKGEMTVSMDRYEPFLQTCDIKAWFIAVGAAKTDIKHCEKYTVKFTSIGVDNEGLPADIPAHKKCIRIDWCGGLEEYFAPMVENPGYHTPIVRIDSMEELNELTELLKMDEGMVFYLDNNHGDLSYNQLTELLDDAYFEEYSLVLAYVTVGSGSIRFRLDDCPLFYRNGEATLVLPITKLKPEMGTADMAGWFICAAINKAVASDNLLYAVEYETEYSYGE